MGTPLFIADATTLDSASTDGNCGYPPTPLGVAIPCPTIITTSGPLMIVPDGTPLTPVPGVGLFCAAITRTAKVVVNNGVIIEGKVPCCAPNRPGAGGDGAQGSSGTPNPRNLTAPVIQNRIVIGSGGSYVPPEFTE